MEHLSPKPAIWVACIALAGLALACNLAGCKKPTAPAQHSAASTAQTAPPQQQTPPVDPQDRSNPLPTTATWVHTDKLEYRVGETMALQYAVQGGVTGQAWIGLIPAAVEAQDASSNAAASLGTVNLAQGAAATGTAEIPAGQKGDFCIRLFGPDAAGTATCLGQTKIIVVHDWQQGNLVGPTKPYVLLEGQQPLAELKPIPKITVKPGTTLKGVYEIAEAYPQDAWIGVIPAEVGNRGGDENVPARIWFKELSDSALAGTIEFTLDKPGEYYVRMFPCTKGNPTAVFQSTRIIVE